MPSCYEEGHEKILSYVSRGFTPGNYVGVFRFLFEDRPAAQQQFDKLMDTIEKSL